MLHKGCSHLPVKGLIMTIGSATTTTMMKRNIWHGHAPPNLWDHRWKISWIFRESIIVCISYYFCKWARNAHRGLDMETNLYAALVLQVLWRQIRRILKQCMVHVLCLWDLAFVCMFVSSSVCNAIRLRKRKAFIEALRMHMTHSLSIPHWSPLSILRIVTQDCYLIV